MYGRKRMKVERGEGRTNWKICLTCSKMKAEEIGLTAGDGQRWYCSERCLNQGERQYRGRRGG